MMIVTIEPARTEDAAGVVELLVAQLAEHQIATPREGVERAVAGVFEDPRRGLILVARGGGELVGVAYVSFIWALEHGGLSAWLEELYVRPGARGQLTGTSLVQAAVTAAKKAGCAAVDLEVESSHGRAERLYERLKFRRHARGRWVRKL